jgi:hypothetical protein
MPWAFPDPADWPAPDVTPWEAVGDVSLNMPSRTQRDGDYETGGKAEGVVPAPPAAVHTSTCKPT